MVNKIKVVQSNAKVLNIAIVGAGLMGYWHSQFALKAGACIIAIVDNNLSNAKALALKINNAKPYADIDSMLADNKPDVIHICTPVNTHADLAKQTIESGVHVLVEKPLACTSAQVIKIHQLAEAKNILISPIHQFCFQRGIKQTVDALKNFGKPLRIDFNIASAGAHNQLKTKINDVIEDILPHPLSILRYLWPEHHFDCRGWLIKQSNEGELLLLGDYNEIALTLYISMSARPTRCQFSIQTTTGTLHVDLFHDYMIKEYGTVSRMRKIIQPLVFASKTFFFCTLNLIRRVLIRQPAYPGLQELISRFYSSVIYQTKIPICTKDTIDIAIARDEISAMMKR
jgi:predicted dehydrogenase